MNIFSLIYKFLGYLGLNCKSGSILFIGLDNAGKTSLLNLLKNKCHSGCAIPTQHPNSQEVMIDNIQFTVFDLGGNVQGIF